MKQNKCLLFVILWLALSCTPVIATPMVNFAYDGSLLGSGAAITVDEGDTFEVEVWADTQTSDFLIGFGFDVDYGTSSIFTHNDALKQVGSDFMLNPLTTVDSVVGLRISNPTPGESILLATLSLTALNDGTQSLGLSGTYDSNQGAMNTHGLIDLITGWDINVNLGITVAAASSPQVAPEPGTMILAGMGFLCIAWSRRKSTEV